MIFERYKHISFDLDGTLVHTMPEYRYRIVADAVNALGGNAVKLERRTIDRFWFEAGRDAIIRRHFSLDPHHFWETFRKLDKPEKRFLYTSAYPDVEPTFERLKEHGKVTSIITGAPRWIARMEIEKLGAAPHNFSLSIQGEGFPGKPSPESFHHTLAQLNVYPHETLYVGNSNEDAYYAKNAGADFMYLDRGEHSLNLEEHAVATIHSLDKIFNL